MKCNPKNIAESEIYMSGTKEDLRMKFSDTVGALMNGSLKKCILGGVLEYNCKISVNHETGEVLVISHDGSMWKVVSGDTLASVFRIAGRNITLNSIKGKLPGIARHMFKYGLDGVGRVEYSDSMDVICRSMELKSQDDVTNRVQAFYEMSLNKGALSDFITGYMMDLSYDIARDGYFDRINATGMIELMGTFSKVDVIDRLFNMKFVRWAFMQKESKWREKCKPEIDSLIEVLRTGALIGSMSTDNSRIASILVFALMHEHVEDEGHEYQMGRLLRILENKESKKSVEMPHLKNAINGKSKVVLVSLMDCAYTKLAIVIDGVLISKTRGMSDIPQIKRTYRGMKLNMVATFKEETFPYEKDFDWSKLA